jgi:hypothetical protein
MKYKLYLEMPVLQNGSGRRTYKDLKEMELQGFVNYVARLTTPVN